MVEFLLFALVFVVIFIGLIVMVDHHRTIKRLETDLSDVRADFKGYKANHRTVANDLASVVSDVAKLFKVFKDTMTAVDKTDSSIKQVTQDTKSALREVESIVKQRYDELKDEFVGKLASVNKVQPNVGKGKGKS